MTFRWTIKIRYPQHGVTATSTQFRMVKHDDGNGCGRMRQIGRMGDHRDASRNQLKQVMMNHVARFLHAIPLFSTMKSLSSPKLLSRQRRSIGGSHAFVISMKQIWARRVHLSAFRHNHRSSAYSLLAHCTVEPGGLDHYENHRPNANLSAGPD